MKAERRRQNPGAEAEPTVRCSLDVLPLASYARYQSRIVTRPPGWTCDLFSKMTRCPAHQWSRQRRRIP